MKIVELWAKQIIDGKKKFNDVPRKLKDKVKKYLNDNGYKDLINEH